MDVLSFSLSTETHSSSPLPPGSGRAAHSHPNPNPNRGEASNCGLTHWLHKNPFAMAMACPNSCITRTPNSYLFITTPQVSAQSQKGGRSLRTKFGRGILGCGGRAGVFVKLGAGISSRISSRRGCVGIFKASLKPEAEAEAEAAESEEAKVEEEQAGKSDLEKDISKAVRKTAATFAPRASSARSKNPAQPGTTLYSIFEVQAYVSMVIGGVLSFNLLFPSDQPDLWRLMGMWSVWMFTIPSLRARDCPTKEKDALNYLFLAIPLINVTLPLIWKSFPAVWSADVLAFFAMYAWKLEWLGGDNEKGNDSAS